MEIKIRTLDSRTHSFEVDPQITVSEVKQIIAPQISIENERLRLIFKGCVLRDDATIGECGVDGAVIHAVERVPAPPIPERAEQPQPENSRPPTSFLFNGSEQISRIIQAILQGFQTSIIDSQGRSNSVNTRLMLINRFFNYFNVLFDENFSADARFNQFLNIPMPSEQYQSQTYDPEFTRYIDSLDTLRGCLNNFTSIFDYYIHYCRQTQSNMANNNQNPSFHTIYQTIVLAAFHSMSHIFHHFSELYVQYNPSNDQNPFQLAIPHRLVMGSTSNDNSNIQPSQSSNNEIIPEIDIAENINQNNRQNSGEQTNENNSRQNNRSGSSLRWVSVNDEFSPGSIPIGYQLTVQLYTDLAIPSSTVRSSEQPSNQGSRNPNNNSNNSSNSQSTQNLQNSNIQNIPATFQAQHQNVPVNHLLSNERDARNIQYCPHDVLLPCNSIFLNPQTPIIRTSAVQSSTSIRNAPSQPSQILTPNNTSRTNNSSEPERRTTLQSTRNSQSARNQAQNIVPPAQNNSQSVTLPNQNIQQPNTQATQFSASESDNININTLFPQNIASVIKDDINRQKNRELQGFSDSYLNSCPNKKRKLDEQNEASRFFENSLFNAFFESLTHEISETVNVDGLRSSLADDQKISSEYQNMVDSTILKKIKSFEIVGEKYPECQNYGRNKK